MASQVRPRPRPRPRPPVAKSTAPPPAVTSAKVVLCSPRPPTELVTTVVTSSPGNGVKSPVSVTIARSDDVDDSYFDRSNRFKLKALAQRAAATTPERGPGDSPESTPSSGEKRKAVSFGKHAPLPKWTKGVGGLKVKPSKVIEIDFEKSDASSSSSSDHDDEVNITPKASRTKRAITPPPAVTAADLLYVKRVTRENLAPQKDSDDNDSGGFPSPTTADADLDPELAAIAAAARARSQSHPSSTIPGSSDHDWNEPGPSQAYPPRTQPSRGKGEEFVLLTVRIWAKDDSEGETSRPLKFKVRRNDEFRRAFDVISTRSKIAKEDLIVTYEKKRVFKGGSPDSLNIFAEAELDAYHHEVYAEVQANRNRTSATPDPERAAPEGDDSDADSAADDSVAKLHLTLRSATHEVKIAVRPTTRVSKLIEHFLRSADKVAARAALIVEGEELGLDDEIGDFDLEDGDLVEVRVG